MTALAVPHEAQVDINFDIKVWAARSIARAILASNGELDFHDAVDRSWADAVGAGLIDEFGADHVQATLALVFRSDA